MGFTYLVRPKTMTYSTDPVWITEFPTTLPSKVPIQSRGWTNASTYFAKLEYSLHSMSIQVIGRSKSTRATAT